MKKLLTLAIFAITTMACNRTANHHEPPVIHKIEFTTNSNYTYSREWQQAEARFDGELKNIRIKGRGNSTFSKPKHPYALQFNSPQQIAGLPPRTELILLANIFDHSLMRNALALKIAQQTSLNPVTPRGVFANLYVNNKWEGLYYLCEGAVDMVSDSLMELDTHNASRHTLTLPQKPIDTLSFADYYIVNELCMNAELNGPRSFYTHVDTTGTMHAGPVWDFDLAFNEVGVDNGGDIRPAKFKTLKNLPAFLQGKTIRWLTTDSLFVNQSVVFAPLLNDRNFRLKVMQRWKELKPKFESLTDFLDVTDNAVKEYAQRDQELWNSSDPARFDNSKTYNEAFAKLKSTYRKRLDSLDRLLDDLSVQ